MPHPLAAFYRGKRVLVTGHTGFTTGWLVAWLKLLGARVCGYGLPPSTRPNFFDATLLDRGMTSVFGDVHDRDALAGTFADFQPEIVLHAAWSQTDRSPHDPVEVFATNVMGTVHVLEEARLTDCARATIVIRDSSGNLGQQGSPHSGEASSGNNVASQAAAELAAFAYLSSSSRQSKLGIAVARIGWLIGGGDWTEGSLVPALVRDLNAKQPIVIRESPAPFNCSHVLESVRACLALGERLYDPGEEFSGAWDFAPAEEAISTREFSEKLVRAWGSDDPQISAPGPIREIPDIPQVTTKARRLVGTSALSLDEAIAWTVEWYKAFCENPASAWRVTEHQIERYAKLTLSSPTVAFGVPVVP